MGEGGADGLGGGKELGVRCSIIGGATRGEALEAAYALVSETRDGFDDGAKEREFMRKSDSVNVRTTYARAGESEWLRPWLWTGAVRTHGAPCIAIVGSPREIAEGGEEVADAGVAPVIL